MPLFEAAITLSIALVAVEIVNSAKGRESFTARLPWLIAFALGLFHGLGFAGALSAVGLPDHAIPFALLFFNVGVEIGQLVFMGVVMIIFTILRRASIAFLRGEANCSLAWPHVARAHCIGGIASFW